jgi:hypothetical protein
MKSFLMSNRHFVFFVCAVCVFVSVLAAWAQRETAPPPGEPVISPELLARPTARVAPEAPERGSASTDDEPLPMNDLILRIVKNQMPRGGNYATSASAFAGLRAATGVENNCLDIQPDHAQPSFCSGATYLVFLTAIEQLQRAGRLTLDAETMDKLLVRSQPDGSGIWGRWNSNGPGTARLFYELKLGHNFTSYSEARPGDFVKLFWNDGIGASEHGHSAVFLSLERDSAGGEFVNYWSSNQAGGFGYGRKERSKIRRVLFSRLEHPSALARVRAIPAKDDYLASMLKRSSSPAEMYRMVGLSEEAAGASDEAAAPPPRRSGSPAAISTEGDSSSKSPSSESESKPAPVRKRSAASATPAASPTPEKKKKVLGIF